MTKPQIWHSIKLITIFTGFTTLLLQLVLVHTYMPVKISSSLEKIIDGNTQYIVNFDMPDAKINPVSIDDIWWLFRYDRTIVYSKLVELQHNNSKQEYCIDLYGVRIPTIFYQKLVSIKKIEDCIK